LEVDLAANNSEPPNADGRVECWKATVRRESIPIVFVSAEFRSDGNGVSKVRTFLRRNGRMMASR
jgi:hypothetical protein